MASPQDNIDCETSDSMNVRQLFCKSVLGKVFKSTEGGSQDLFKAYPGTLHSLDRLCEETKFEESGLANKLCLDGLAEAQTCYHREGSYNLSPKVVALCVHISNIICLNGFLFCLRIERSRYTDGDSAIDMSGLTDELSRLSNKWKWSGDSCKDTFHQWKSYTSGADPEKAEAMKLLYQWTYPSLNPTFARVDCELDYAFDLTHSKIFEMSAVDRVSKLGDELCNFLEEYKTLFANGDTEFLYEDIFYFHRRTAQLHQMIGNVNRVMELLQTIAEMLDAIWNNDLMVTKGGNAKIAYLKLDPVKILLQMWNIHVLQKEIARRYMVHDAFLWNSFMLLKDRRPQGEVLFKWYLELLQLLDQSCEGSRFEESCLDELDLLEGLEEELICHHERGSRFNLGPGVVACCLHVANVISFNCFLFCLRIGLENQDGSVIDMFGLTDEISRLSDKWKWGGDLFKNTNYVEVGWRKCIKDHADFKEEAMKLLFQWTILPLSAFLVSVKSKMNGANVGDDQLSKVDRVSKWGDELCNFLKEYRKLFQASEETEFLYDIMYDYHCLTAELHLTLGNKKRAKELLLNTVKSIEDIIDNGLMVTKWGSGKIAYLSPNPATIAQRKWNLSQLLMDSGAEDIEEVAGSFSHLREKVDEVRDGGMDFDKFTSEEGLIKSQFDRQLYDIIKLMGEERLSEARDTFELLDLEEIKRLNGNVFRRFLEFLNRPFIKFHSCSTSTLNWGSFCERQVLLLDVCEALGDRQLTAIFLEQYGTEIAENSVKKLPINFGRRQAQNACINLDRGEAPGMEIGRSMAQYASIFKQWLKEELNLEFPMPAPECVEVVISCLSGPSSSDEHKRENLPEVLKAIRLLKRSSDIYSDLLHDWTQGNSYEDEWLKLLESRKSVHETLQSYLLQIALFCIQVLLDSNDPSVTASNYCVAAAHDAVTKESAIKFVLYTVNNPGAAGISASVVKALLSSTLVWVERGRARTLLTQLGPWYYIRPGLREELIEFDKNDQAAISSILSCQSACNGQPLFVEYNQTLAANKATAFMIHKHELLGWVFNCEADQMKQFVDNFYDILQCKIQEKNPRPRRLDAGIVEELHEVLEKLYDILIGPFSEHAWFKELDPESALVFVPDKMLYRVPFALLRDKRTKKYLFQLHPIAISPSLRVLQHCERRLRDLDKAPLKPDGCILAVGNATYEKYPLPGTKKELEHLQSCFPGRVKTLQEDEATRANFLELVQEVSPSKEEHVFAVIHLGVHGHWTKPDVRSKQQYNTGSLQFAKPPMNSTGGFRGPTTDISTRGKDLIRTGQSHTLVPEKGFYKSEAESSRDGERRGSTFGEVSSNFRAGDYKSSAQEDMLPSEDIVSSGLEWRTRLVVLSACNSSRGLQDYSDGEVNLPRALMIAGVPAAVVSQWKIDDFASPMLMEAFYKNMRYGQDVATALQSAMIKLSNDPDSDGANNIFEWGSFLVWGLPTVQLPQELWTEKARKIISIRKRADFLRRKFDRIEEDNAKVLLLNALKAATTFLEAAYSDASALEDLAITGAIDSIERLLSGRHDVPELRELEVVIIAMNLAEEVYSIVPPEQLKRVVLELEKRYPEMLMLFLRQRIMFSQAMKGSHQIALEYANKMIEVIENAYERTTYDQSIVQIFGQQKAVSIRQERAVILRLMGRYEEAWKEFDDLLAPGEDYACLIQMSYLKHLMEDENGALEYALRAKNLEGPEFDMPGYRFTLGIKALPDEYGEWLLNVDEESTGASSSSVHKSSTVQRPKNVCTENA